MARYKVTLAYDGTRFLGFQRQESAAKTVQSEVEAALLCLNWQGGSILSAGRTDSGVHASGQVIAFDLEWNHSPESLGRAMNAHLPPEISVRQVQIASPDFHPRFDAVLRRYRYQIFCDAVRDPLREKHSWRVWPAVDETLLVEAAQLLIGTHDFAAFGSPPRPGGSTLRMVYEASWKPQAGGLLFEISANAFLYHMVRRVVYLQVLVGQSRLSLGDLAQAVQKAQPQTPGLAPPHGLVLAEVNYL